MATQRHTDNRLPTAARVLSIQSQLVYGIAGNNAAVPILQRAGHKVFAVPTTLLSNTPVYPAVHGGPLAAGQVDDLLRGLVARTGADGIDAILTGYMAEPAIVEVVATWIRRLRQDNPTLRVHCDPVIGDAGPGRYVVDGVAETIADKLLPLADLVSPNAFELDWLCGYLGLTAADDRTGNDALHQAQLLSRRLDAAVLVTGIVDDDDIVTRYCHATRVYSAAITRRACSPTGTGDALAALYLAAILDGRSVESALDSAVASMAWLLDDCLQRSSPGTRVEMNPAALPVA